MRKRGATSGSGSLWPAVADLAAMDAPALSRLWRQMTGKKTPADLRGDLLIRDLADLIQSEMEGGLSLALRQLLKQLNRETNQTKLVDDDAAGGGGGTSAARRLSPGTRLIRVWQGSSHEVVVLEDGFLWRGERLQSLSLIAKRITGTSWNGWRFFGIAERKRSKSGSDNDGRKTGSFLDTTERRQRKPASDAASASEPPHG
jgi:hypothetical protein